MAEKDIIDALEWRYAVKKFDSAKKIPSATWEALEQALVLTPSSYGLQPWKFIVVQDKAIRQKLLPLSWGQAQVTDCSHYIVFLAKTTITEQDVEKYIQRISEVRGVPSESLNAYKEMMLGNVVKGLPSERAGQWAARQAYIALGNLMTTAAILHVDACPMEGIEPEKYDEVLELAGTGYHSLCCLALGYRASDDQYAQAKKVRFEKGDVIEMR